MVGRKTITIGPGSIAGLFLQVGSHEPLKEKGEKLEEKESSPMEDLMKKHGAVERIMLIYQRMIEKAITGQEKMEDEEEKTLGETGFRGFIGRIAELEKEVGCYELSQYTAQLDQP